LGFSWILKISGFLVGQQAVSVGILRFLRFLVGLRGLWFFSSLFGHLQVFQFAFRIFACFSGRFLDLCRFFNWFLRFFRVFQFVGFFKVLSWNSLRFFSWLAGCFSWYFGIFKIFQLAFGIFAVF